MKPSEYDALVRKETRLANSRPSAYRRKVWLMMFLGYGYIAASLFFIVILTAISLVSVYFVFWLVFVFFSLVSLLFSILSSLKVTYPDIIGVPINLSKHPHLNETIQALRKKLQAPKIHEVILTNDLNASVVQRPRLGMFGWHKNYLTLGLPLMKALTPEEFKSVIAHELGHVSRSHGISMALFYRTRIMWQQMHTTLSNNEGYKFFSAFSKWYAPRYLACSFAQIRQHEYVADRIAAQMTSNQIAGSALCKSGVFSLWINEEFSKKIDTLIEQESHPKTGFCAIMLDFLSKPLDEHKALRFLNTVLARPSDYSDTHPSLSERLAAIKSDLATSFVIPNDNITYWLGAQNTQYVTDLDNLWIEANKKSWRKRHHQLQKDRARWLELKQLRNANPVSFTSDNLWELGQLSEQFDPSSAALECYREVLRREPEAYGAKLAVGRILVKQHDSAGESILKELAREKPQLAEAACDLLRQYYLETGRENEANDSFKQFLSASDIRDAAEKERQGVNKKSKFLPHGVSSENLDNLLNYLSTHKIIAKAWLVRKDVEHYKDNPLYILCYKLCWYCREGTYSETTDALANSAPLPNGVLIIGLSSKYSWMQRRCKKVHNSLIYEKGKPKLLPRSQ